MVKPIVSLLLAVSVTSCSSYTNQPNNRSASPPALSSSSVEAIHSKALVLDAHADIEIPGRESRYVGPDGRSKVEPSKMEAGGVDAVVMAIAVGPMPRTVESYAQARAIADEKLEAIKKIAADPANNAIIVRSADELVKAHEAGKNAFVLSFQNALILGEDIAGLDEFFAAGVKVFALTHLGHNAFADSSRPLYIAAISGHEPEEEHGGLSDLGRSAVKRINELGGIVDISQLSKAAAVEVINLSTAPVIASHSNVRKLSDVSRNLSDDEIDLIGKNGGVIHIAPFKGYLFDSSNKDLDVQIRKARREAGIQEDSYYPFELYWEIEDKNVQQTFLQTVSELLGPGSVDAMVNHIDYIVGRIGVDHVGIGTDFNHGSGIVGFQDASEAMNVTKVLLERGYSEEEIIKIWGGNFLRVFEEAQNQGK
ncbi:MAG: dipeptidase [Halioglobus sp.]